MQKAKVSVLICQFAYGGNGGVSMALPQIGWWLAKTYHAMKQDERIDNIGWVPLADTPITMTRNKAVRQAIDGGYDMVLMLDSDNEPDGYLKSDPNAKPFWEVAFDLAYSRLIANKPTIVVAPYCGPPPHPVPRPGVIDEGEVPYLFEWLNNESDVRRPGYKLHLLNRNEAAKMRGIHPVAAGPTGLSLWTTNVFEGMKRPIFDYTMSADGSEKETTEDVFATRNASLFWQNKIRENVLFAACDSWALHHKPKAVGRPSLTYVEQIADDFRDAIEAERSGRDALREVSFGEPAEAKQGRAQWHEHAMATDVQRAAMVNLVRQHSAALGRKINVVEIGTWLGDGALVMAETGCCERIICVDHWLGAPEGDTTKRLVEEAGGPDAVFAEFQNRVADKLGNPIVPLRMSSAEAAALLADRQPVDLIVVDGDHTAPGVTDDIDKWWPNLAGGGLMAIHDYGSKHFTAVSDVVNSTFEEIRVIGNSGPELGSIAVVAKAADPEEDSDLEVADDDETPLEEPHAQNGNGKPHRHELPAVPRRIGGRKVFAVGQAVADVDLKAIGDVARVVRDRALLLNPWSGEVAAAVLAMIPETATLYILDDSTNEQARAQFVAAFKKELDEQRIKVMPPDILAKLKESSGLDLIIFNRSPESGIAAGLIAGWLPHVAPNGVLAGLGYSDQDEETQMAVLEFAEPYAISPRRVEESSVWVIPKKQITAKSQAPQEPSHASSGSVGG